jgi:Ni/Fe-hydrogenase subunit HybB-like protein
MLIYWNIESPLFEVAICVMTYATVLGLEISPIVFERFNMRVPLRIIRSITIPLVILGVILSTMHQSSLGTLFVLMPHRMAPLWYSKILPVLFLVSAVAAGLAMVVLESNLSTWGLKHKLEFRLLEKIARVIPYVLGLYLVLKGIDMAIVGNFRYLFTDGTNSLLFWIEIMVGTILPLIFLTMPAIRGKRARMFSAALMVVIGLVLNRFNISMITFNGGPYMPSWQEIMITIGLVCVGALVFTLASRFLNVFSYDHAESKPAVQLVVGEEVKLAEEMKSVPVR